MNPVYKYSESTVKPVEIEKGKRTVFLRTDITEEERTDDTGNTTTFWTYQEARMTPEEFTEYSDFIKAKNAIKGTNDSENIAKVLSNLKNEDDNQLTIMEAIADLYTAIANSK